MNDDPFKQPSAFGGENEHNEPKPPHEEHPNHDDPWQTAPKPEQHPVHNPIEHSEPHRPEHSAPKFEHHVPEPPKPEPSPEPSPAPTMPLHAVNPFAAVSSDPEPGQPPLQPGNLRFNDGGSSGLKNLLLKAYAYLPEYLVTLIVLASFVFALTSLFSIGIDSLTPLEKSSETTSSSSYFYDDEDVSSFQLVSSLATLAVTFPLFILLYLRTKNAEKETPAILTHRWRKAFLGIFIVVLLLDIICSLGAMAFDLISRKIDLGGVMSLISRAESQDPWWQSIVTTLITVVVITFVVVVMSRGYKASQQVETE